MQRLSDLALSIMLGIMGDFFNVFFTLGTSSLSLKNNGESKFLSQQNNQCKNSKLQREGGKQFAHSTNC